MESNILPGPVEGPWDVTPAQYHADRTAESSSTLKVFRESVPLYHGRYVTGSIPHSEPSAQMALGTAVHVLFFQPVPRTTRAGKQAHEDFAASLAGRDMTVVTASQALAATEMVKSALANGCFKSALGALGDSGEVEKAVRWRHPTGVWLKCMFDKLTPYDGTVYELKTSAHPLPRQWPREVLNYGYHHQAALYLEGAFRVFGFESTHIHLVIGSTPPYEAVAYTLDEEALELAARQNLETLERLADCRRYDSWGSRWADRVHAVSLPPWADES
jgi:hypothetical protein